ncbi:MULTISPECIES: hypothetical protein [unclassified Streptomyces]|uniref:hypothetical protein n=1 Tax=unclassified Streptomyces TaxID=2593676 RepID=UPI002E809866|nr:hypothetical protein [Streptomyces sp. NBC_00589]WTI36068.1 hypothetical protein OIC96_14210 [Streptomyces sp. NBC_00775]WUB30258.1 hypothetical protein OHA51_35520 [Streptomyces sp. NBC_00589]
MKTVRVIEMDGTPLDDLVRSWDEIRVSYRLSRNSAYDRAVLDCAARLAADPGGESAYVWTFGLAVMAPYAAWRPGDGVVREAVAALEAADRALRERPCDHDSHPYENHRAEEDKYLARQLPPLADETAEWAYGDRPRDEWRCPRNAAGFARIAMDVVDPGSVPDIPPRLSVRDRAALDELAALLHGYPKPWTDVEDEISSQAWNLSDADPADRAGRLQAVRAVTWYAVSGLVTRKSVLDELVEALEETLPHFAGASCTHDRHAPLPDNGPDAAELGVMLSSSAGRRVHEKNRVAWGQGDPLENVACPVLMAEIAAESLTLLREGRARLFGPRDTSHADAAYLRPDGRLEIEKIAERLDDQSRNEPYADDLGLWAARRHTRSDARERAVLLLTAHQAMRISYPCPPRPVVEGVLATMRAVADAPRPEACAHDDSHPTLERAEFRHGLPHFYAPEEFPPAEEYRSPESWTCPRFAGEVAEACVSELEDLYEDDEEDEGD